MGGGAGGGGPWAEVERVVATTMKKTRGTFTEEENEQLTHTKMVNEKTKHLKHSVAKIQSQLTGLEWQKAKGTT